MSMVVYNQCLVAKDGHTVLLLRQALIIFILTLRLPQVELTGANQTTSSLSWAQGVSS